MDNQSDRLDKQMQPQEAGGEIESHHLSHSRKNGSIQQNSKMRNDGKSDFTPSKVHKMKNNPQLQPQHTFYIEEKETYETIQDITNRLLTEIQLLNYEDSYRKLNAAFRSIVSNYVTFNELFPKGLNRIGRQLLKNGLFHEMWGKVCKRGNKFHELMDYYNHYYSQITTNFSNFQATFNQYSSSHDLTPAYEIEQDSNTRLTRQISNKPFAFPISSIPQQLPQKDENEQMKMQQQKIFCGRLRLIDKIQTNERRLNAQIVCYFLGIKEYYSLVDIQIDKIVEFYHSEGKQLLIVQTYLPVYNKILKKEVIDIRPKLLVAVYGFVNFSQLLRIKLQYQVIDGFILYDELLNLPLWLKSNGFTSIE